MMKKYTHTIKGITLVEVMIVVALLVFMLAGLYASLSSGRAAWFTTDAQIELQENLRRTITKVSRELRESGFDSLANWQVTVTDGGGVNNTDIIRFAIPIICEAGGSVIDVNGDVANWGAPLTWGCTDSTCMDADNNCATEDYEFVEYRIDANNQLLRRVLNGALAVVRQDVFAQNIADFQITVSADQNVVTLSVTATRTSNMNRVVTASANVDVYLRNRG